MGVLLVAGKDSYTEKFLALLPCTCILQPMWFIFTRLLCYFLFTFYSDLNQFKVTIFSPLQWAHQIHSRFKFPSLSVFLQCLFFP
jgi:hypothetical protein